jgi:putative restriction endonuclease
VPSLSHSGLVAAIQHAVTSSGYAIARLSKVAEQPERFLVSGPSFGSQPLWVYVKNLTPADRLDPDEYRIQLRSAILPLQFNPDGPTVLLGYHAGEDLFVGFDPRTVSTGARTQLSGGYVSLRQVKLARLNGMAFDQDRLGRIAVGVRPETLVAYCLNAPEIHESGAEASIIKVLNRTAMSFRRTVRPRTSPDLADDVPPGRQRLLRSISVLARDAGFRHRVLQAYGMRCAVSGAQLGLVEAAHILPVCVEGSTDRANNGLALLPQYHRAFDTGLIFLTTGYVMRLNGVRASELRQQGIGDGLEDISRALGRIGLPRSKRDWPDPASIRAANRSRGVGP